MSEKEILLKAIEERSRQEGVVPTDVHYKLLMELRKELRDERVEGTVSKDNNG